MLSIKVLIAVIAVQTATANAAPPPAASEIKAQDFYQQASAEPPKQIDAKQLSIWLDENAVILIDLRGKESYAAAHIRGAINVPIELLTLEHLKTVVPNSDSRIVVYCSNNFMPTRMIALTTLGYPAIEQLGYSQVHRLEDLWSSASCRESEKLAGGDQSNRSYDAQCESLLPMDRAKK
jgi:hypothetical protein